MNAITASGYVKINSQWFSLLDSLTIDPLPEDGKVVLACDRLGNFQVAVRFPNGFMYAWEVVSEGTIDFRLLEKNDFAYYLPLTAQIRIDVPPEEELLGEDTRSTTPGRSVTVWPSSSGAFALSSTSEAFAR